MKSSSLLNVWTIFTSDGGMEISTDACGEAKLLEPIASPTQILTTVPTGEMDWAYEFHENHGRNVKLEKKTVAKRVASYNQGN